MQHGPTRTPEDLYRPCLRSDKVGSHGEMSRGARDKVGARGLQHEGLAIFCFGEWQTGGYLVKCNSVFNKKVSLRMAASSYKTMWFEIGIFGRVFI